MSRFHGSGTGAKVRALLEYGLESGQFTCAAAAVGQLGDETTTVCVGDRDPDAGLPITFDTRFDLASLTKPIVTTTLVFQLLEAGRLTFDDVLADHLPELTGTNRGEIPLHTLLTHTSGLKAYAYSESWDSRERVWADLLKRDLLTAPPGERFEYSCLNFVHLERCVEAVTGAHFGELADRELFGPIEMEGATMGPPRGESVNDPPLAVTYDHERADRRLEGDTNDPIARAMGGYSGNAGLFATLSDVVRFAKTMLGGGQTPNGGAQVLSPASIKAMRVERARSTDVAQGYGWRLPIGRTPAPIWRQHAIGHTGYTGTSLWLDFEADLYAVLLTNAVYVAIPELERFRQRFHSIAAASVAHAHRSEESG